MGQISQDNWGNHGRSSELEPIHINIVGHENQEGIWCTHRGEQTRYFSGTTVYAIYCGRYDVISE